MDKKIVFTGFLIFAVFIIIALNSCWGNSIRYQTVSFDLSEVIKNENIDDIILTIYYINPHILTDMPLSIDGLIGLSDVNKIVVTSDELEKHIDLFKQISSVDMVQVKNKSPCLDVRLYYILESEKNGKLFDVAIWSGDNNFSVNGIEVIRNDIFFDIILPFLTEDAIKDWEVYLGETK